MASPPGALKSYPAPQPSSSSAAASAAASQSASDRLQGQGQQHPGGGRQERRQDDSGGNQTQRLLQGVAATTDLLRGCIQARENLGAAKTTVLRAGEDEARKPPRPTRPMVVLCGGSWEDQPGGVRDWREWPMVNDGGGGGEKVAAAMEAALPLAREFAERMAELAGVVPELSRSLVGLTEVTTAATKRAGVDDRGARSSASTGGRRGQGVSASDPLSGECEPFDYDFVQELIKVAPPAIARLLSFEHLRASGPTARDLVQALVNLYVGVGSGLGGAMSRVSRAGTAASSGSSSVAAAAAAVPVPGVARGTAGAGAGAVADTFGSQETRGSAGASSRASPPSGSSTGSRGSVGMSAATSLAGGASPGDSSAGRGDSGGIRGRAGSVGDGCSSGSTRTPISRSEAKQLEKLGKKATSWVVGILKQALVPKVYGGKLVRSKGVDGLLGRHGVGAVQHSRAVQEEILKNAEVLQGLVADDLASERSERLERSGRLNQRTKDKVEDEGVDQDKHEIGKAPPVVAVNVDKDRGCETSMAVSSTIARSNPLRHQQQQHELQHEKRQQQQQQQRSGRKRPRPVSLPPPPPPPPSAAIGTDTERDPLWVDSLSFLPCGAPGRPHRGQLGRPAEREATGAAADRDVGGGVSRLFGGAAFVSEAAGGGVEVAAAKGPRECLLESTVEAFCSMLETGEGGGGGNPLPTQLLRARLQQVAYHQLLTAPSHGCGGRGGRATSGEAAASAPSRAAIDSAVPPRNGRGSEGGVFPAATAGEGVSLQCRKGPPPADHSHPHPHPHPHLQHGSIPVPAAEWESRVRGCLSALARRPLLCPDALLRGTGARPSFSPPPEAYVWGSVTSSMTWPKAAAVVAGGGFTGGVGDGGGGLATGGNGSGGGGGGFQLPEACLLVGLDLVEEAILEEDGSGGAGGGGEAAAGLLRAFRTVRNTPGPCGAGAGRGGGVSSWDRDRALGGEARGCVEGGGGSAFAALLDQPPSGCMKKSLDALVRALEREGSDASGGGGRHGEPGSDERGSAVGLADAIVEAHHSRHPLALCGCMHGTPHGRTFEEELWLLLLGYRHWILVALVYLLSEQPCASCASRVQESEGTSARDDPSDRSEHGQRHASAVLLLAWYACGGTSLTSIPPRGELREAQQSVREMAACLTERDQGDPPTAPPPRDTLSSAAEATASEPGPQAGHSSPPGPLLALQTAGKVGKGLMGAIFSPFLAVAWLLSSRLALSDCEGVLSGSVLTEHDLDLALARGAAGADEGTAAASRRRAASVDRVLQGFAALEDLVWLCGLDPPISSHAHTGQDLKTLLGRTKAWLSGVARRRRHPRHGRQPGGGGHLAGVDGCEVNDEASGTEPLVDFAVRTGAISRQLERLVTRL